MDPTAPKKDQKLQDPKTSTPPQSPIQPGQFVVAGDEDGVFKEPQAPASSPASPLSGPLSQEPKQPVSSPLPPLPSQPPSQPPGPGINLSAASQPLPSVAPTSSQSPEETSTNPSQPSLTQPDPTPYVAPQPGDVPYPNNTTGALQEPPSLIKKLRMIAIFVVVLVLVGALVAVAWFFVLGKKSNESVKTENTQQAQVEEPSPLPKRTTGGFAELPVATSGAEESTPQAE